MTNKFKNLFFALPLLFNLSCHDEDASYEYQITNTTESDIQVYVYATKFAPSDVTHTIPAHESKIIYYTSHGVEGPGAPYFQDVSIDLQVITVKKNDTNISNRDYRLNENWQYSDSFYSAIVTEAEFQ